MNHLLLPVALVCAVQLAGYEAVRIGSKGCKTLGATCASCEHMKICASRNSPPIIEKCPRETPYCSSGSCGTLPNLAMCGNRFNGFSCPVEDGTYPDGEDCKIYHICVGGEFETYNCTIGDSRYMHRQRACRRYSASDVHCYKAECSGSEPYAVYKGDKSVYFLCNGGKPTMVHRCPHGTGFDKVKAKCTRCLREGRMIDVEGDGTTFIECTEINSSDDPKPNRRKCPSGSKFDPAKLECLTDGTHFDEPTGTPNR